MMPTRTSLTLRHSGSCCYFCSMSFSIYIKTSFLWFFLYLEVLCGALLFPRTFLFLHRQCMCMSLIISFHEMYTNLHIFFSVFSEMDFKSWIRSKIPTDRVNSWKNLLGRWESVKGSTFIVYLISYLYSWNYPALMMKCLVLPNFYFIFWKFAFDPSKCI